MFITCFTTGHTVTLCIYKSSTGWLTGCHAYAITCKRGSAKHSVKDDHAFLWKNSIFRHLPSRNPSTDQVGNFTRLIMSASISDVPKMVGISWLEAAPQIGEIQLQKLYLLYISFLTLPDLFYSCKPPQQKQLKQFACTMAETTRFNCCKEMPFGVALI
jgi:hypothetical protein